MNRKSVATAFAIAVMAIPLSGCESNQQGANQQRSDVDLQMVWDNMP